MNVPNVRPVIAAMTGYVPGEQPKWKKIIKLNTNENPYPPTPRLKEVVTDEVLDHLRLYPDPVAQTLREEIASFHGVTPDQVIAANGSDDILTILARCFLDETHSLAMPVPTYSLYRTLAELQNAPVISVPLEKENHFALPADFPERIQGASIVMLARPNAPTGNAYPLEAMKRICDTFDGAVLFDEAYADFAEDNCDALLKDHPNAIISRTFSKSRSLAGIRFGYALAHPKIIQEMMKVKDSYNVNALTQLLALTSFRDHDYLAETTAKVKATREIFRKKLEGLGFRIIPSQTNFLFAAPPNRDGKGFFEFLRTRQVLVRYFPGEMTGEFVRITIGLPEDMDFLLECARDFCAQTARA